MEDSGARDRPKTTRSVFVNLKKLLKLLKNTDSVFFFLSFSLFANSVRVARRRRRLIIVTTRYERPETEVGGRGLKQRFFRNRKNGTDFPQSGSTGLKNTIPRSRLRDARDPVRGWRGTT